MSLIERTAFRKTFNHFLLELAGVLKNFHSNLLFGQKPAFPDDDFVSGWQATPKQHFYLGQTDRCDLTIDTR